jgi:hypothetical protein
MESGNREVTPRNPGRIGMIGGLSPGGDCARIYFDFVRREPIASDFDKRMGSLMSSMDSRERIPGKKKVGNEFLMGKQEF